MIIIIIIIALFPREVVPLTSLGEPRVLQGAHALITKESSRVIYSRRWTLRF